MEDLSINPGDLVVLRNNATGIVISIWDFDSVGTLVAVMVDGDVKVFDIHEITKVIQHEG
jgi:hypothetical protein